MKQVLTIVNDYLVLIVAILGGIATIVEKSRNIKINPLTGLFRKAIKDEIRPLEAEVSNVKKDINSLSVEQQEFESRYLRRYILTYASQIRNGEVKTNDEYEDFFRAVDRYEMLIKKLKIKNGYVENEVGYVKDKYNKIWFLKTIVL